MNGGTLAGIGAGNGTYGHIVLGANVTVGGSSTSTNSADVRIGSNADRTFTVNSTGDPSGIDLDYTGKIGTQANGFFALDYTTASGKQRALYTQFENSDARRFIPSWDEPNYKASFDLSVLAPAALLRDIRKLAASVLRQVEGDGT